MQTVLHLMSEGKLPVEKLTSHRLPIERAPEAYELITGRREPFLGILLEYSAAGEIRRRIDLRSAAAAANSLGVSLIGVGQFCAWRDATGTLQDGRHRVARASARPRALMPNIPASAMGSRSPQPITPRSGAICRRPRSSLRLDMTCMGPCAALRAGKHVFVEKPLCIRLEEQIERIGACIDELGDRCPILTVGFNRRFAPGNSAFE